MTLKTLLMVLLGSFAGSYQWFLGPIFSMTELSNLYNCFDYSAGNGGFESGPCYEALEPVAGFNSSL